MNQHYTPRALDSLDNQIITAEERLSKAMLSMGAGADSDNNTWHDNPAFEQAKMDVDQARNELSRLRELRRNAIVIETIDPEMIGVGSTVVIKFTDDDPMRVHIAGHYVARQTGDSDDATEVSTASPLGAALLNHKAGDTVTYTTPNNTTMEVLIVELV